MSQILHGTYLMLKKKSYCSLVFLFAKYCSLGLGPWTKGKYKSRAPGNSKWVSSSGCWEGRVIIFNWRRQSKGGGRLTTAINYKAEGSISPPLELGLALWLVLAGRMPQRWGGLLQPGLRMSGSFHPHPPGTRGPSCYAEAWDEGPGVEKGSGVPAISAESPEHVRVHLTYRLSQNGSSLQPHR